MTVHAPAEQHPRARGLRTLVRLVLGVLLCVPQGLAAVSWQAPTRAAGATRCCCVGECRCTGPCCDHGPSYRPAEVAPVMSSAREGLSDGTTCRQPPAVPARPGPENHEHCGELASSVRLASPQIRARASLDLRGPGSQVGLLSTAPSRGPPAFASTPRT